MVYLKSLVAGAVAVAMGLVLSPIVMGVYFYIVYRQGADEATGWDPTPFVKQPLIWALTGLMFMAGFLWGFRRAHPK